MEFLKSFVVFTLFALHAQSRLVRNSSNQQHARFIRVFEEQSKSNCTIVSIGTDESEKWLLRNDVNCKLAVDSLHTNGAQVWIRNSSAEVVTDSKDIGLARNLNKLYFDEVNVFSPVYNSHASRKCQRDSQRYLISLKKLELWALKMWDSSARIPSGILNGNVNQFGDYDQCLEVAAHSDGIRGQYCLANMQIKVSRNSKQLTELLRLVESHNIFRSEFTDPGHRIPRFSSINWAICAPSSCSPADLESSLKNFMRNITSGTGVDFKIRVDPEMCNRQWKTDFSLGTVLGTLFFALIIAICWVSTIYDYRTSSKNQNKWLVAFSTRKNLCDLFSTDERESELKTVHGIRFFNAIMLLFSHKSMAVFFNPYINRTQLSTALSSRWTVAGRAASLYTDPFLLFSGLLASYSITGRLKKGKGVNFKSEYIGRILRILPSMIALIIFCTFILPELGSGPQWNLVVRHHANLCKKNWWRNIFFVHNLFGFNNMCLTHTHHIALDTQLFLFSPILTLSLWLKPMFTTIALLLLATYSTFLRFYTTAVYELSNYIYFGTNIRQLFNTADFMYTSPLHRCTIYIIGVLLGYFLRMHSRLSFGPCQLRIGWLVSVLCMTGTLYLASLMNHIKYTYDTIHAGYFASLAPLTWCLIFVWVILTSYNGYENRINSLLSWKGFQVTTKFSYALYLTQFPIFFYNVGRRRSTEYFNFIEAMVSTNEYICILIASLIVTVVFEIPFKNIKRILFG